MNEQADGSTWTSPWNERQDSSSSKTKHFGLGPPDSTLQRIDMSYDSHVSVSFVVYSLRFSSPFSSLLFYHLTHHFTFFNEKLKWGNFIFLPQIGSAHHKGTMTLRLQRFDKELAILRITWATLNELDGENTLSTTSCTKSKGSELLQLIFMFVIICIAFLIRAPIFRISITCFRGDFPDNIPRKLQIFYNNAALRISHDRWKWSHKSLCQINGCIALTLISK